MLGFSSFILNYNQLILFPLFCSLITMSTRTYGQTIKLFKRLFTLERYVISTIIIIWINFLFIYDILHVVRQLEPLDIVIDQCFLPPKNIGRYKSKQYYFDGELILKINDQGTIEQWVRCNYSLTSAYTESVASSFHYHQQLVKKGYRILIYR